MGNPIMRSPEEGRELPTCPKCGSEKPLITIDDIDKCQGCDYTIPKKEKIKVGDMVDVKGKKINSYGKVTKIDEDKIKIFDYNAKTMVIINRDNIKFILDKKEYKKNKIEWRVLLNT